ncbi:MAG: NAD(P)/FAD-dependent oxidoreductase [Chloroflexi bacterium]|nr:NAD(P)/FAD-dependent oxidoreductase [Chloroflexota bacterium]
MPRRFVADNCCQPLRARNVLCGRMVRLGYDAVIVGAGPAGSMSAALFAQQGRRVLLVDAALFPRSKPCAELISPGGVEILRRTRALPMLGSGRWLSGMELRSPAGACHILRWSASNTRQALCVARTELDTTLLEFARACGAEVHERFRVRGIACEKARVVGVIGPRGECIRADLTVGADGLHSIVARALGLRHRRVWPRRLGLTAHFNQVHWPQDTGTMRISANGYVGAAPVDNAGRVSVGLVRGLPRGRLGASGTALTSTLRSDYPDLYQELSTGQLEGHVAGMGPLATRVRKTSGRGYALVGDAAGFLDPFTGEGIFRALRSAELLAENPSGYSMRRRVVFGRKERLISMVQVVVQTPALLDFAVRRLNERPLVASELGAMLGDVLEPKISIAWRLLGP